jgi:hypothetical protein
MTLSVNGPYGLDHIVIIKNIKNNNEQTKEDKNPFEEFF